MDNNEQANDFESVKMRLAEIAEAVDDDSLSLDEALDLYEEAVALGLQASDLLESGIVVPEEGEEAADADEPAADTPVADSSAAPAAAEPAAAPAAEQA